VHSIAFICIVRVIAGSTTRTLSEFSWFSGPTGYIPRYFYALYFFFAVEHCTVPQRQI